jgi:hypothetical protein
MASTILGKSTGAPMRAPAAAMWKVLRSESHRGLSPGGAWFIQPPYWQKKAAGLPP